MPPPLVVPPATRTRPSERTVAVCPERGVCMTAAAEKFPSVPKISALATGPLALLPPIMSTRPSCNSTAAASERTSPMGFQVCHVPVGTLGMEAVSKKTQDRTSRGESQKLLRKRIFILLRHRIAPGADRDLPEVRTGGTNRGENRERTSSGTACLT